MQKEVLERIRGADIFSALGSSELSLIAGNSDYAAFQAGEAVFAEGSPGDALYIVMSGEVGILKFSEEGESKRIAELISGDCFGELDLLTGSPRTAHAHAIMDSKLLRFPARGKRFDSVMEDYPAVAAKLLRSLLAVISGRTRKANALIKENTPLVRELKEQVYGDKLSGLNNRAWLEETLPGLCADPTRPLALLMFKPDNFKAINDRFGHEAGDRTIVLMSAELKRIATPAVLPFRFAGNELGFAIAGCDRVAALRKAEELKDRMGALDLSTALQCPEPGKPDVRLSISVGIALFPEHGKNAVELIAAVNELPLEGRARGGNLIVFPGAVR